MTGEEMERAIQFLIEHHAKVSTEIKGLNEAQKKTAANIASLAANVSRLEAHAQANRRERRETFHILTEEMRARFNKLILSNEVARDLSNQVARLCH
jgi:predicted  nucleic acid-binding Zn-ribbon protein